jgi:CheY-like chemotaxis protein
MHIAFSPNPVVEDVPNVLKVSLRGKGYPVVTARNGQAAWEQVNRDPV